jgi:hypothetical protein
MEVAIIPHPNSPHKHTLVKVTHKGRIYACTWAGTPTSEDIQAAWILNRRSFMPYNEATGRFLKE